MNTIQNSALREKINDRLNAMIEQFYSSVPGGTYQRDSEEINVAYYRRHTIETILRIKHKRMIDALVIHYFTKHDPKQAKFWAHYIEDEMLHGHLFAKDLQRLFDMSLDDIYAHEPLFATKLLNGYFYYTLEHEGPMASLVSAYFLEYTTRMTQPVWLDNLEKVFGKSGTLGARAHVNHDIKEDHSSFVWNVLMSTVKTTADEERLSRHLENIYGLFAAYFAEIHQLSFSASDSAQIPSIAVKHASGSVQVAV